MTGGRLKIEVLPAGAVVPAFSLLDAVSKGTLDGGHGVMGYNYGKNSALALWTSGPGYGMDANMVLAWHNYGGGKALLDELYKSLNGADVVSYLYGPMPTQPLGWFKKPVAKAGGHEGPQVPHRGPGRGLFTDMGAAVNPLPGGEIVPALDRGLIDGGRVQQRSSDRVLGFPTCPKNCMLQSFHQLGRAVRNLFNKHQIQRAADEAEVDHRYATQAVIADMSWKAIDRNSKDYIELQEERHQVLQDARRRAARAAGDRGTRP
jgi:TRAP-type mannitol/chloroaromatic compound transport system substrate-binding protein